MESTIYKRQETIGLTIPNTVGLVGVGGVGSWLAYFLALAGVPNLVLFDHDTVSDHNLNRLPLTPQQIGLSKSEAISELILSARPATNVKAFAEFIPEIATDLKLNLDWIVAGTDSLASRRMVAEWAKAQGVKYIELAAEGEMGSVMGEPADWSTPDEENPGYASVPVWVGPCTMAASIAADHILHNAPIGESEVYRVGWSNNKVEMTLL